MARRVRPSPPAGAHWPRTLALPDSTLLSSHVAPPAHRRHTWTERDTYAGPRPHWGSDEDRTTRQADEGSPETATSGPYTLGMRYPTRQCDWGVGVSGCVTGGSESVAVTTRAKVVTARVSGRLHKKTRAPRPTPRRASGRNMAGSPTLGC